MMRAIGLVLIAALAAGCDDQISCALALTREGLAVGLVEPDGSHAHLGPGHHVLTARADGQELSVAMDVTEAGRSCPGVEENHYCISEVDTGSERLFALLSNDVVMVGYRDQGH